MFPVPCLPLRGAMPCCRQWQDGRMERLEPRTTGCPFLGCHVVGPVRPSRLGLQIVQPVVRWILVPVVNIPPFGDRAVGRFPHLAVEKPVRAAIVPALGRGVLPSQKSLGRWTFDGWVHVHKNNRYAAIYLVPNRIQNRPCASRPESGGGGMGCRSGGVHPRTKGGLRAGAPRRG